MDDIEKLSQRIRERVLRQREQQANQTQAVEREMEQLVERRRNCFTESGRIMKFLISPRVHKLCEQFDKAVIEQSTESLCICRFNPSVRYPARVAVEFSVSPDEDFRKINIRYRLELLPILMKYKQADEATFPLVNADSEVGSWVEARIFEFLDTYLLLETHPMYQRENVVTDPICGMGVLKAAAITAEQQGITYYFCSENCKDAFLHQEKTA